MYILIFKQLLYKLSYVLHMSMIINIYIFIFLQFSPNWTLRRGAFDMPAYCLFPRVQHHLYGSGKAASLWRWQMGQGHSLLERCAAVLQVQFATQALCPVFKVICEIQYEWTEESKGCTGLLGGGYRWRDVEKDGERSNQWGRDNEGSWTPFGNRSKRMLASQLLLQGQGQSVTLAALQIN